MKVVKVVKIVKVVKDFKVFKDFNDLNAFRSPPGWRLPQLGVAAGMAADQLAEALEDEN